MTTFGNASNLDLQVGASVEVAFVVDATGADSSTVSAGTDVLNEIDEDRWNQRQSGP